MACQECIKRYHTLPLIISKDLWLYFRSQWLPTLICNAALHELWTKSPPPLFFHVALILLTLCMLIRVNQEYLRHTETHAGHMCFVYTLESNISAKVSMLSWTNKHRVYMNSSFIGSIHVPIKVLKLKRKSNDDDLQIKVRAMVVYRNGKLE